MKLASRADPAKTFQADIRLKQITPLNEFRGEWLKRWDVMHDTMRLGRVEEIIHVKWVKNTPRGRPVKFAVRRWAITLPKLTGTFKTRKAALEKLLLHHQGAMLAKRLVTKMTGVEIL